MSTKRGKSGLVASLSIGSTVPMIVLLLAAGGLMLLFLNVNIDKLVSQDSRQTTELMEEIVRTEVDGAVINYLRATAEKNRDLMAMYYERYRSGGCPPTGSW